MFEFYCFDLVIAVWKFDCPGDVVVFGTLSFALSCMVSDFAKENRLRNEKASNCATK